MWFMRLSAASEWNGMKDARARNGIGFGCSNPSIASCKFVSMLNADETPSFATHIVAYSLFAPVGVN